MTFTGGTRLVLSILEICSIDTRFLKWGKAQSIRFLYWVIVVGAIIGPVV